MAGLLRKSLSGKDVQGLVNLRSAKIAPQNHAHRAGAYVFSLAFRGSWCILFLVWRRDVNAQESVLRG